MAIDFENPRRTVWEVMDRVTFLESMREMLNIDDEDVKEISGYLQESDFDYLEIASYLPGNNSDDPDAVLVFDGKKDVFWDIFETNKSDVIIAKIHQLAGEGPKLTQTRRLTQADWKKRLEALGL